MVSLGSLAEFFRSRGPDFFVLPKNDIDQQVIVFNYVIIQIHILVNLQKIMNQKPKYFQLTAPVTQKYLQKIAPYELVIESIALQNKQIYELEKKYIEMSNLVKNLQPISAEDEQLLKTREKLQIVERKTLMQQALVCKEQEYRYQYEKHKNKLEEQIRLLKSDIELNKGNKINIFMNLREGILSQLLQENRDNEEATKNIKFWKDDYERSKRSQN